MADNRPKITVVGSSNMDLVVKSQRIPVVGETILGGDFIMVPGGKGANQAVAAAKLGAEVFFVARLGRDIFATHSLANFKNVGVSTKYVLQTDDAPSGVALIMVDEKGNNSIVVAPGANARLTRQDVQSAADDIAGSGAVVAQLEVPIGSGAGMRVERPVARKSQRIDAERVRGSDTHRCRSDGRGLRP